MSWQEEFVIVKNETDKPVDWEGQKLQPGGQAAVPYLKMMNSHGDPRSIPGQHRVYMSGNGERGVVQPREVERSRVSNMWSVGPERPWTDIPPVTFYTMDGERIFTVVDDPQGDHVAPAELTVDQQAHLQKTVDRQQEVIDRLLEVSGLDKDAIPPDVQPVEVPPDIPTDDSTASDTQSPFAHAADDLPPLNE